MATCASCGCEFNISSARRKINRRFGAGEYDSFYDNGEDGYECYDCALESIGSCRATGEEIMEENWSRDWGDD